MSLNTLAERLINLIERLNDGEPMLWEEVFEAIEGCSGWEQWIALLREQQGQRPLMLGVALTGPLLSPEVRAQLATFFRPYALLLAPNQTPMERADALRRNGTDVERFGAECVESELPEVAVTAQDVLAAHRQTAPLLRSADQPTESLLRAATSPSPSPANLLRSAESSEIAPPAPSWFRRLLAKFRRARKGGA